jgi:hypothetical protein
MGHDGGMADELPPRTFVVVSGPARIRAAAGMAA